MSARLEKWAGALDSVVEGVGRVAAWTCLVLVLVMAGNVLMRYAFHTGSVATQELEWHLMSPLVLFCIAYTLKHEGHLRVDVFYSGFPERAKQAIDLVSIVIAICLSLIIIKLSIPYVLQSYRIGEGSPDPGGLSHRYLLKATIPIGFGLLALQSLAEFLRALKPFIGDGGTTPAADTHASH